MSMNLVTLLYLIASVCFIQALKGLSHPTTSIRGNVFGMTGMAIAVVTTAALIYQLFSSFIRQIQQNFTKNVVRYFRPLKIGLSKVVDPIAQRPIEFWRNYNLG